MNTELNKKKLRLNILLSALFAGIIFIIFCIINHIAPFGQYMVLRNDGIHQYAPFLINFVDRIKNGNSILYSWNFGGGVNQYSVICYYLLSPFNLIALPFNTSNIDIAMFVIILAKTMCIAASFCYYISKKFKAEDITTVAFSLIFTFSGFYLSYYYNTMWLDALITIPLVALGIENIVNGKKATLYFFALAYTIFVNFYIGYMVCIFSVLYFFYLLFAKDISKNNAEKAEDELPIMQVMAKFGTASLIAGLCCAVVIIPVIYSISKTMGKESFSETEPFFNFFDFLSFHLTGIEPPILEMTSDIGPYVLSSMLTFLTVPAFFFLKNIKPNKKVATAVVLVIFYFSFAIPKMNYFWHGFSAPSGLPYRFSFLYILFIITLAYEVIKNLKEAPVWAFGISAALIAIAVVYTKYSKFEDFFLSKTVVVSLVFAVLYLALLLLAKYKVKTKKLVSILLLVIVLSEILTGDYHCIKTAGEYSDYYPHTKQIEEAKTIANISQKKRDIRLDTLRSDVLVYNESAFYSYNGISSFSSLDDSQYDYMQRMLGNEGNMFCKYAYMSQTPLYNSVFSLNFIYDTENIIDKDNPFYEALGNIDEGTLYKVKYTLPLGYCVNNDVENWDPFNYLTLSVQNNLWQKAVGTDCLKMCEIDDVVYTNCVAADKDAISQYISENAIEYVVQEDEDEHEHEAELSNNETASGDSYGFSKEHLTDIIYQIGDIYPFKATKDDFSVTFKYVAKESGELFAVVNSGSMQTMTITRDDGTKKQMDVSKRRISDIGYFKEGEKYTITISNPDRPLSEFDSKYPLTDSIQMSVASVNEERFAEGYNQIIENGVLDIKEFEDAYIYGTVNAKSDCVMMMPMPYDEGWTVYVDGEPIELLEHESHIMMFKLSAGEHEVEMSYFPLGLREGIFVSVGSALGLVMVLLLARVHKMKLELVAEEEAEKKEINEKGKE